MVKFDFIDFWGSFNNFEGEWLFNKFLKKEFGIKLDSVDPDFVVFSISGNQHRKPKYNDIPKVFYTAENYNRQSERFDYADFTVSHHHVDDPVFGDILDEDTHLVMPIYLRAFGPDKLVEIDNRDVEAILSKKEKYCCFITRNEQAQKRRKIFEFFNTNYKKIDSAGKAYNNMVDGWRVPGKWKDQKKFVEKYKFMINVENDVVRIPPGYTSEKIFSALRSNAVPIYWGDPRIERLFNTDSFVNLREFDSLEGGLNEVKYLDQNDEAYRDITFESIFEDGDISNHSIYDKDRVRNFFEKIIKLI